MQSIGFSDTKIQSLLQGNEPIDEDLAQRFFSLRYLKKRSTLILSYEKLCDKKFTNLPSIIQKALVDFSYNMCGETGIFPSPGFSGFPEACKALKNEDWALFAHEIAESTYATQVGPRRAGYWVYQLTQLSDKPLTAMTGDVRAEVRSFKKVKPEMEERIRIILAESHRRERG
jgi:hypothetical protein